MSFLPAAVRVHWPKMNPTQKQFPLTGASLKKEIPIRFPLPRSFQSRCWFLVTACALALGGRMDTLGHAPPPPRHEDLKKVDAINAPPQGKALINFYLPEDRVVYPVILYDAAGVCLVHLLDYTRFQFVCEPGEQVVIGQDPLSVTLLKADVEAGKVYDVILERNHGFKLGHRFVPLRKGEGRRAKVPEYERQYQAVGYLRNDRVNEYDKDQKPDVARIQRDFLGGKKASRVAVLQKDDCR